MCSGNAARSTIPAAGCRRPVVQRRSRGDERQSDEGRGLHLYLWERANIVGVTLFLMLAQECQKVRPTMNRLGTILKPQHGKIVELLLFLFFPSQHAVSRNDNDHRHGRGTLSPRPPRPCRQMGELRVSDRTPPTRSPACSTPPNKKGFADEGFLGAGG